MKKTLVYIIAGVVIIAAAAGFFFFMGEDNNDNGGLTSLNKVPVGTIDDKVLDADTSAGEDGLSTSTLGLTPPVKTEPMDFSDTPDGDVISTTQQPPQAQDQKEEQYKADTKSGRPRFDITAVHPDGFTLNAVSAKPGQVVELYANNKKIANKTTDSSGTALFEQTLEPGDYELSLTATDENGKIIKSRQVQVVKVLKADKNGTKDALVVETDREGGVSKIRQRPKSAPKTIELSVDTVDYNREKLTGVSGMAPVNSKLNVYLDNELVGQTTPDNKGSWQIRTDIALDNERHVVRVDQLGDDAKVQQRSQVPFSPGYNKAEIPGNMVAVVRPGHSLWRIARRIYGSGFAYTTIYNANSDQIADPDLIYPGQIFILPSKQP